jgi:hypothetical protein
MVNTRLLQDQLQRVHASWRWGGPPLLSPASGLRVPLPLPPDRPLDERTLVAALALAKVVADQVN